MKKESITYVMWTEAPLLKRLEKQGYIDRGRPDDNERKLFISLTETGKSLEEEALRIPQAMTFDMMSSK